MVQSEKRGIRISVSLPHIGLDVDGGFLFSNFFLRSFLHILDIALLVGDQVDVYFYGHGAESTAIILKAYTTYECAKDEVAIPLTKKIFDQVNEAVSAEKRGRA